MNGAFHIAGVGLGTQQSALDTVANNIANLNTRGFKRSSVQFSEMVAASMAADGTAQANLSGVSVSERLVLDQQGALERTDDALDLAIEGSGFIELMGADGQTLMWRGGRLSVTADGFLASQSGLMLASQISVPDSAVDLRISERGDVSALTDDGTVEDLGQVGLMRLVSADGLTRRDGGLYRLDDARAVEHADAGEGGMGLLVQGSLERSNVDLNREMVDMMIIQRAYAANAQVVQAADQLLSISNNLRR